MLGHRGDWYLQPATGALVAIYQELLGAAPPALGMDGTLGDGTGRAKRPRVLVAGPKLAPGRYNVLKMAADAGVEVVVEGIFGGVRGCWRSIDGTGAIKAREDGIFMLAVESYYHTLGSDSLNTRLEAFVETLRGGLIDA